MTDIYALHAEIARLAKERDAVILAHNYEPAEVQDTAHHVGDSLGLSRIAAQTDASVIVFAGVHFMAETAKILSPEKMVLLPEAKAGCPMADMITAEQAIAFKAEHPGVPLVTYVNSSAAVKAVTDICCTSANAVEVVRSLGAERILFAPDRNLGAWVASKLPEVEVIAWDGYCPVHDAVSPGMVIEMTDVHPLAEVMTHPECRPDVNALADAVLSTSQMLGYVNASKADEFVVVTEAGLLHGLSKAAPHKRFYNVEPKMTCADMKRTSLEKVRDALRDMSGEVVVPDDVAAAARASVERMVSLG